MLQRYNSLPVLSPALPLQIPGDMKDGACKEDVISLPGNTLGISPNLYGKDH